MSHPPIDSRLANQTADAIFKSFIIYRTRFREITRRAKLRFKDHDWKGMQADAAQRLGLYKNAVDRIEIDIRRLLADRIQEKQVWASIKAVYSDMLLRIDDWELAETFFNSVTRRIYATVGVNSDIEFVNTDFNVPPTQTKSNIFYTFEAREPTADLIQQIFAKYQLMVPFLDIEHDADQIASKIKIHLSQMGSSDKIDRIDMARNVFYRGMGAYLIGRIYKDSVLIPLAIALLNLPDGGVVDGVLLNEDDVSILFSFTRAHFHVEVDRPYDLIHFLKTILPNKRIAELYISTGFNKHGKTELYRELLEHLTACYEDRFDVSRGQRGMVMIVFNMPSDDLVFKLIRDQFGTPKKTTRREVIGKYDMVFRHDRAGRLIDAHEFEYLKFDACCFSPQLLTELSQNARKTVRIGNDFIIVNHGYVERRVTPLDVFLKNADESQAQNAVIDWGHAIKDLAVSNIFPGDILLKNFGITRHGRVVFYDYDEICTLTSCHFRNLPPAADYEDEMASEPWFYVDENDVFPEEFIKFIGLPDPLKAVFLQHHADLFEIDFWQRAQEAIQAGELPHIFPYSESCRFKRK
ncbi:MAG: bifunctional isocitrate dehydrogenase kinase/phosphatase [Deltaproteobacteria bacterium]|nr:bifunctional isocitrate dehydrogenase kinase/phosphatase [Deltaproteobacteria bacterium]